MGKRFRRTPVSIEPPKQEVVLQNAVPPFLATAITAFETAYGAIFEQTIFESQRLTKVNAALKVLEDNLLDLSKIKEMDSETQVALYNALNQNAAGSTRLLIEISRSITQTRAVASIMSNLRRMATAYEQQSTPNQGTQESKMGYTVID